MGALADAVNNHTRTRGPRCSVAAVREQMDPDTRAEFDDLLDNPKVASSALARGVTDLGFKIGQDTIQRHRRQDCGCG